MSFAFGPSHALNRLKSATYTLEGEDLSPQPSPDLSRIRTELSRLRVAGPDFLILSCSDGSYIQAAGTGRRLSVELHDLAGAHSVIGRAGPRGSATHLDVSGGRLAIFAGEVLTRDEAVSLFEAFLADRGVPTGYQLRDISEEIASSPVSPA